MSRCNSAYLVFALASGVPIAHAQDVQCIYENHKPATVRIDYIYETDKDGRGREAGTGFLITPSGYVITNAHVVTPRLNDVKVVSSEIKVRVGGLSAAPVPATVSEEDIDESSDVALIKIAPAPTGKGWPTLPVSYVDTLPVGSTLIGLGFASEGDIAIVPPGQKTSESTVVDDKPKAWWQTSLALSKGNSGGPIFGKLGTVVGIAVAINRNSAHLTYVIPIARAQHLLEKAGVNPAPAGACADFPLCRHPSHGIEAYKINEIVSEESEWRYGGGNPKASENSWCSDYLGQLQQSYPDSSFTKVRSRTSQDGFDNATFRIGAKYKYICEYRRLEGPIYKQEKSRACLVGK